MKRQSESSGRIVQKMGKNGRVRVDRFRIEKFKPNESEIITVSLNEPERCLDTILAPWQKT
jgi:hypothetical protein